ncbi:MAG: methyltransferase [Deltaproteobacteria bacterium]|nr:methyltransferase [Deltaproteobacteria bacterium]
MSELHTAAELEAFVRERTAPAPVALVPELRLYQATDVTPLWHATWEELRGWDDSPYWAFPWAGGQALARHLLDHPELVRGKRVLDLATGSGLVAIAAARAGAASVRAVDVDPFCAAVVPLNAALNGVTVAFELADLLDGPPPGVDLLTAGDVFYEKALAERALTWFRAAAAAGVTVLCGDPGRTYSPRGTLPEVAAYEVPTSLAIEEQTQRRTAVLAVLPPPRP